MEIQGKVIEILEPKSGQSSRGTWKKQDFVIETDDSFPKKVCITNWQDKVDLSGLKPGDDITASINIESREFKGNWYTDVKVWKMDVRSDAKPAGGESLPGLQNDEVPPPPWEGNSGEEDDGMPF